jgi:Protein of unknown function (DUF1573)
MKQLLTIIFCSLFSFAVFAQTGHEGHNHDAKPDTVSSTKADVFNFKELAHNFGKIPQGKPVYYNFEIVNGGLEPAKLVNVTASCGCTTPEWSRDAIAPGATSIIKVGYNAVAEGPFKKYITINYAGGFKQIEISGEVWKAPEGAAPANASVQFLKKQNL